jgi:hypothetical protein
MNDQVEGVASSNRPAVVRIVGTVAMVLALFVADHVMLNSVLPAITEPGPLWDLLHVIPLVVVTGLLGTRVSYRFIDGFWWLVPPVGIYLFVKFCWRITSLPARDWPLRPDERTKKYPQLSAVQQ